jgi:hypothetical protein
MKGNIAVHFGGNLMNRWGDIVSDSKTCDLLSIKKPGREDLPGCSWDLLRS